MNFKKFKDEDYGKDVCSFEKGGSIDYSLTSFQNVVGVNHMTYDDYLDIQRKSLGHIKSGFAHCFYNIAMGFKGRIERITKNNRICFKAIYFEGMYPDGEMFEGKEDHVWMAVNGFENLCIGDCVSFWAEVYRYVKTGNGKIIDFGLRNPEGIKKIESYELPTDDDLISQTISIMLCDTCFCNAQCNRELCIRNPKDMRQLKKDIKRVLTTNHDTEEKYHEKN